MKCLICETKIDDEEEVCATCKEFFLSQNRGDLKKLIERFRASHEYLEDWRDDTYNSDERRHEDEA